MSRNKLLVKLHRQTGYRTEMDDPRTSGIKGEPLVVVLKFKFLKKYLYYPFS